MVAAFKDFLWVPKGGKTLASCPLLPTPYPHPTSTSKPLRQTVLVKPLKPMKKKTRLGNNIFICFLYTFNTEPVGFSATESNNIHCLHTATWLPFYTFSNHNNSSKDTIFDIVKQCFEADTNIKCTCAGDSIAKSHPTYWIKIPVKWTSLW